MGFFEHLFRLIRADSVTAHLRFGSAIAAGEDRKALAGRLHQEVVTLKTLAERAA